LLTFLDGFSGIYCGILNGNYLWKGIVMGLSRFFWVSHEGIAGTGFLGGMGWFFFKMLAIYNPHLTFRFMVRFPSEVVVIPNFDCFGPHILTVIANAWKSKTNVWSSRKQSFPVPTYF
jgi:hypothetical protein